MLEVDDARSWTRLWQGYLEFYEHELDEGITARTWRHLVGGDPEMVGLGATDDGELIGLCHLVFHASTWSASSYCYLEDLFVDPRQRGRGVGRSLIAAARNEAERMGATKLYWQTHLTNVTARRLYDSVADHRGFLVYEVDLPG